MPRRTAASPRNSEWLTRRTIVDPKLAAAGWRVCDYDPRLPLASYDRCAIVEYPTDNGPADYALSGGGRILGIVEAKKLSLGPQNVLTQAERYSRGATANPLSFGSCRVPFLYSTNGELIWHHDIRHPNNRSREISAFHSPAALEEKLNHNLDVSCAALRLMDNDNQRRRLYPSGSATPPSRRGVEERRYHLHIRRRGGAGAVHRPRASVAGHDAHHRQSVVYA